MKKKRLLKIIALVGFLFISILCFNQPKLKASTNLDYELIDNNGENVIDYYETSNGIIKVYNEYIMYLYAESSLRIEGILNDLVNYSDSLYVVLDNSKVFKLRNGLVSLKYEVDEENIFINSVYVDKNILLIGEKENNGLFIELSSELKENKRHEFDEGMNLHFKKILKYDNYYYLAVERKGQNLSSVIKKVGNFNDLKTIVIKLNSKFNIVDVFYFNQGKNIEQCILMKIYQDKLYLVIKADSYYGYQIDLKTYDIELSNRWDELDKVLVDYNGNYLQIDYSDNLHLYGSYDPYELDIDGTVLNMKMSDGYLKVYVLNNNNIYLYNISEYHIDILEPFVVGYNYGLYDFDNNLNNCDVLSIESYFSKVEVYNNTSFEKNVSGSIDIELLIRRESQEDIKISDKVIIESYCNIIDGYCYRTGKTLNFIDSGVLDGLRINSGHSVIDSGTHELVLTNRNGEKKIYKFVTIDNYYLKNSQLYQNIDSDVEVRKNENYILSLNLVSNNVEEVIVDGKSVEFDINTEKNIVNLYLKAPSEYGISKVNIEKIKIDGKYYTVDKEISVLCLKDSPQLEIKEEENDELSLSIDIKDDDLTILYLMIVNNENKPNIESYYNYIQDNVYKFKEKEANLTVYLCYDLGNKQIQKVKLCSLTGLIKNDKDILDISYNLDTSIHKINIKVYTKNFQTIDKLMMANEVITYDYVIHNNYFNIFISLALTIILITGIVFIVIFKKKQKSNK